MLFGKKFGPGTLLTASNGRFLYKEDSGKTYGSKCSLWFDQHLEGKHYDWLKVKLDSGWIERIEGQETLESKL